MCTLFSRVSLAYLSPCAFFCRRWKGEIAGKVCARYIALSLSTLVAGMAGGVAGAALGSLGGPIGTLLGGIVGGLLSAKTADILFDRLTQKLFGLPKDEALANAYCFFDLPSTASNGQLNAAYHKLVLAHHPDKGGDQANFELVMIHFSIIKLAREEGEARPRAPVTPTRLAIQYLNGDEGVERRCERRSLERVNHIACGPQCAEIH
jgi:hypothetical protein